MFEFAPEKTTPKMAIKNVAIVIAPLVVLLLIFIPFMATQTWREQRAVERFRATLLYDFDYLLNVLEENVPTLDILYRRHGVDLLAQGQNARQIIEEAEYVYYVLLWRTLRDELFWYAHGISHLGAITEGFRLGMLERFGVLDHIGNFCEQRKAEAMEWLNPAQVRNLLTFSKPPVFYNDLLVGDPFRTSDITFDIIEAGRIAYMRIPRLIIDMEYAMVDTRRFMHDIEEYQHLIIDLRGNSGGFVRYFHDLIGRQLLSEPRYMYINNFYMAGRHNMQLKSNIEYAQELSTRFTLEDAMSFVTEEYLHILEDIMRMDYHYVYRHEVEPFDTLNVPFSGKIWMLVDERVASAAHWVATFYKEIGFATLVGETTLGALGFCSIVGSNFITLPNSGIIVRYDTILSLDPRGRPIEYGTEPHYFNRPGMDALQTVLALIEEGWYR